MNGAGFIRDMIAVNNNNRSLLKGQNQAKYKNFDKSYITDWIISRKPLKFKKASPEYLRTLNKELRRIKKIERIKDFVSGVITITILGTIVYFVML